MRITKRQTRWVEQIGDGVVEFAAGFQLPAAIQYHVQDWESYDAVFNIAIRGGRYECVGLQLQQRPDGPPVNSEALREVAVRDVVRAALDLCYREAVASGAVEEADLDPPPHGVAASVVPDDALARVAQVYQFAYMFNEPPTKAVQDKYRVSRATAGRWVAEARRRGLVGDVDA